MMRLCVGPCEDSYTARFRPRDAGPGDLSQNRASYIHTVGLDITIPRAPVSERFEELVIRKSLLYLSWVPGGYVAHDWARPIFAMWLNLLFRAKKPSGSQPVDDICYKCQTEQTNCFPL